jgi:murein DD-endopeptidase MepM/ murein hydrolase activator NlpD
MKNLLAFGERLGGVVRRPGAYLAFTVPLAIPILIAAANYSDPVATRAAVVPTPQLRYSDLYVPAAAALPEHSVMLTVEDGDTLESVFAAGGLTRGESAALTQQFSTIIDMHRLRPGNILRFHHDAQGTVDSVEMKLSGWGEVDAVRNGGTFEVSSHQAQQREIQTVVAANIETSLYDALVSSGENPALAQPLVDVFQWDIDFFALKKGDSFSLVVKKKYAGDEATGYGPILAARFLHNGQVFEAFRSESDGHGGYYGAGGSPLRKQFLRAPLQFTRVTSGFSNSRFHPLLHIFRPHHGVDYGAPVGTPVMTTADGVVVEAGYKHGEGNYIRVKHTARIHTAYLHLSRFAKGIRPGAKVTQGDVIGYVGMTGLATGPHLDYRVQDGNEWLDPLKLRSITPDPLRGDSLRQFRANVVALLPKLATRPEQTAQAANKRRALF